MQGDLFDDLKKTFKGDVLQDSKTLDFYSHDASIFEMRPIAVVFPEDASDVTTLVKFVNKNKDKVKDLSLTARSAGTDMGGGPINNSIIVDFSKYFNHAPKIKGDIATTEPGVFYRDFEKETLKHNLIFPSYPASREICAMGGIIGNNAGGEKSLKYGKTDKFVDSVKVVLADGSIVDIKPLNKNELDQKLRQNDFEGSIYKKMVDLITKNKEVILKAKPNISKNSAGFPLWNVWDKKTGIFDLTKIWVGSQGTLGLMISADIKLVPVYKHHEMTVIYLHSTDHLKEIVDIVLKFNPESFECYDDNTLKLALKYFPDFAKKLGFLGTLRAISAFIPSVIEVLSGKTPKMVLQADFVGNDTGEIAQKTKLMYEKLKRITNEVQFAVDDDEKKYWLIRRESFSLLRNKITNMHSAPFIDDFAVRPEFVADILKRVTDIFKDYPEFVYTVAGHIGDGNFHIIPLADFKNPKTKEDIETISKEVYKMVLEVGGTISGEHNDGLIRTPYLKDMYGEKIVKLFSETKKIFDPQNIFNPNKKVGATLEFAKKYVRSNW